RLVELGGVLTLGGALAGRVGIDVLDLLQHLGAGLRGPGRDQAQQLVQDHTQAEHVAFRAHGVDFAAGLLGRHVAGRAQDAAGHRARGVVVLAVGAHFAVGGVFLAADNLGDAPVHDLHFAEAADHDVGRLQVAVDHAAAVGERHAFTDLDEDVHQAADGEGLLGAGVVFAQALDDAGQLFAL